MHATLVFTCLRCEAVNVPPLSTRNSGWQPLVCFHCGHPQGASVWLANREPPTLPEGIRLSNLQEEIVP